MSYLMRYFTIGLCAAVVSTFVLSLPAKAVAADPTIAPLNEAPPEDEVSAEIRDALGGGFTVMKSKSRTLCQVWLRKGVATKADFKPTLDRLYAFEAGSLIGVVRYKSKATDFRGQEIPSGVYTLRFALQPVDGDHVGTSDTRDFLLLVAAKDDEALAPIDAKELTDLSAASIEAEHPAILCLQTDGTDAAEKASIRHDEDRDWWIVDFTVDDANGKKLPVALVVVGQSES